MATHPLGPGTVNVSVNMEKPMQRLIGRRAFLLGLSTGAFVRMVLTQAEANNPPLDPKRDRFLT